MYLEQCIVNIIQIIDSKNTLCNMTLAVELVKEHIKLFMVKL